MPGPPPKPAALRQRRNKKAGARTIAAELVPTGGVPDLYDRPCPCGGTVEAPPVPQKRKRGRPAKPKPVCSVCHGTGARPWHPRAIDYWKDLWRSEVSPQYLKVDLHGLFILIEMVDRFFTLVDAGESVGMLPQQILAHRKPYGHTPGDRASMHWEIEPAKKHEDERDPDDAPPPVGDSKKVLRFLA